jgi:hypothetical protein
MDGGGESDLSSRLFFSLFSPDSTTHRSNRFPGDDGSSFLRKPIAGTHRLKRGKNQLNLSERIEKTISQCPEKKGAKRSFVTDFFSLSCQEKRQKGTALPACRRKYFSYERGREGLNWIIPAEKKEFGGSKNDSQVRKIGYTLRRSERIFPFFF